MCRWVSFSKQKSSHENRKILIYNLASEKRFRRSTEREDWFEDGGEGEEEKKGG